MSAPDSGTDIQRLELGNGAIGHNRTITSRFTEGGIMRLLASILFLFMCSTSSTYGTDDAPLEKVNRTFSAQGDLTGTGKQETVTIHILGASINSPLTWDLTVKDSEGKTLFFVKRDDAWLDKFYNDNGYVGDCVGYLACKQSYYFTELPNRVFKGLTLSNHGWKKSPDLIKNLQNSAKIFFKNKHIESNKIKDATTEMEKTLSAGAFAVLEVPISAVQSDASMIWVKSLGMFVPFFFD
jgi:hypothetical protein